MSGLPVVASELLSEHEVELLRRSLSERGGSVRRSGQLAVGKGFADAPDLLDQCRGPRDAPGNDVPPTAVAGPRTGPGPADGGWKAAERPHGTEGDPRG
ncbi:hypothetical protein [Kitasatospora sp. NPDC017646]|uniref:hypothetical protein n=1 Tax=Kitasatospora sp. NPDC017646 TaxID=3364024 RepID=UPI0037BD3A61